MKPKVMISRSVVAYVMADMRQTIADHTVNPARIEDLHGQSLIECRRRIGAELINQHPDRMEEESDDLQWLEKNIFPTYLECCEALEVETEPMTVPAGSHTASPSCAGFAAEDAVDVTPILKFRQPASVAKEVSHASS